MNISIRNLTAGLVAASPTTTLAPLAVPATANAVTWSYVSSNLGGVNLRECANTSCRSFGWLRNGTAVSMQCWTDSQYATVNYGSVRWFRIFTTALGATGGFVHSSAITNQIGVPRC